MVRQDYIPRSHGDFYVWQGDFHTRLSEKLSSFNIDEEKLKTLTETKSKYEQAFQQASSAGGANRADRLERDKCEAEYKSVIRGFVNGYLRFNSNVSDSDRRYLGLTVADNKPTPAAVPSTHPVLRIDFSESRQHTLHITDEAKTGKAKPAGVKECEIWYAIADEEPVNDSELRYAGSSSKANFLVTFDLSQRGKKVYYNARWVNTRGERGPWGEFENAIIT
ncbi:MAG: hypothetical protein LBR81_04250 [Prevotellaceae bacterium]|jgi:hypothetical protein|nr:hypothetical protein [Prevotellaceae bacterium]